MRHAPTPRLGSLCASSRGSHWRQASLTGPLAPAPRATTHYGGDAVGKRPQPRLQIDALTGEWRNGEAGEGRGSEPCEPWGTPPPGRRCVLEGPPLVPGWQDITWPHQVAPRGRKASSTCKIKPQTSNLKGRLHIRNGQ